MNRSPCRTSLRGCSITSAANACRPCAYKRTLCSAAFTKERKTMSEGLYLARQPITDKGRQLYGFELSFLQSEDDGAAVSAGMQATSHVLHTLLADLGVAQVLGKLRGFLAV